MSDALYPSGSELCPSRDELTAFNNGRLGEAEAELVLRHLQVCPACEAAVDLIAVGADSLGQELRRVRGSAEPDQYANEAPLQRALAAVSGLVSAEEGTVISVHANTTAVDHPARVRELKRLREYELQAELGQGGMGTVYKARHVKLGRTVAVKVLPKHLVESRDAVLRFEREMEAIGRLDHPNIVRATDAGEVDGTSYLVMEYVDGADLSRVVKAAGTLPIADACEVARQAALGLQHAAEHDLVHRDVKPSNLILTRQGVVNCWTWGWPGCAANRPRVPS